MKKVPITGIIMAVITALSAFPAVAQQQLTARVINAETKQPVAGANVIFGRQKGTSTNAQGNFSIACNQPLRLRVSYIGFATYKKTIRDCSKSLTIYLKPRSFSLQNVFIQGKEKRLHIKEATSIGELSVADLNKQSGLRLRKALNTIPGVQMQSRSPFGGQRITIRGYYPNAGNSTNFNGLGYQLYFNNVPVTDATGTTIMDDIDFSNLGGVKIIKGPNPLYGNEIAGTVLLRTKRPEPTGTTLSEQALGGSYGLFRNNTKFTTGNEDFDLTLNYGRQSYDGFRPQSASKKDYISVLAHFRSSTKQQISAYFSYNHSDEELAGSIFNDDFEARRAIANPDYVNNDGGVIIKGFRTGITSLHSFNSYLSNKSTVFASGHTLDQNFAHGFNFRDNLNYGARTNFTYQQQFKEVALKGQLGAFLQRSNESVDGVFISPSIHPPFTPQTKPQFPNNKQNFALNANIFTKWKIALPYAFRVTAGGVLNFNKYGIRDLLNNGRLFNGSFTKSNRFNPTFSPSVSVLKSFSDEVSVYASITTGNTPPLLGDILASDGSVNTQLNPERAVQYEAGTKGSLQNNRFTYELALFDLKITDRLATQFINSVSFTTNVGEQQNKGIEFSLAYTFIRNPEAVISRLRLQTSYTYSHFRYDDFKVFAQNSQGGNATAGNFSGNAVAGVAPNRVNAGLDLQTRPGFYLHARYRFMDRAPVTFNNEQYVKSYNLLSGRIGYQQDIGAHVGVNAFVGGNNLIGSTYYSFIFVGQNVQSLGDGYITPAPYKPTGYGGVTFKYRL